MDNSLGGIDCWETLCAILCGESGWQSGYIECASYLNNCYQLQLRVIQLNFRIPSHPFASQCTKKAPLFSDF